MMVAAVMEDFKSAAPDENSRISGRQKLGDMGVEF
jgi:hypothetical protein